MRRLGAAPMGQSVGMALLAIGIKRNGVLIADPVQVLPGEAIVLYAKLGVVGGDMARFTISTLFGGEVVFGPIDKRTGFFSDSVELDAVAPTAAGDYLWTVTEIRPFWPDDTKRMAFTVTPDAPQPPSPPGGGGTFGKYTGWIVGAGILIALVALSPSINRAAGTVLPKR